MGNYGMKISQPGYDVKTCSPDKLVFSSKYKTLRVHTQGSGQITHSGGRTVTIPHNLGYVPYFLVHAIGDVSYWGTPGDYFIYPIIPIITGACYINRDLYAYADDTNLYIKINDDFGWTHFDTGNEANNYRYKYHDAGGGGGNDKFWVGHDPTLGNEDGAFRFNNVTLNQNENIYKAELNFYVAGRDGSDNIGFTVKGIDEDNTGDFGSDPFGRPATTWSQNTNSNTSQGGVNPNDVTDGVKEIISRGGWSSGNHMGFFFLNWGTTGDNAYFDANTSWFYCSATTLAFL